MAKNKAKKISLYDHKGLPIAALALILLLVFLLVTINLTTPKDDGYVQGLFNNGKSYKSTSLIPTVDALIRQIDALLKEDNAFGDNLNDLNNLNNLQ